MFDANITALLPNAPGVGYEPQHFANILESPQPVEWLEIHTENYMDWAVALWRNCAILPNASRFQYMASDLASAVKARWTMSISRESKPCAIG